VRTDEARPTGNQDLHSLSPRLSIARTCAPRIASLRQRPMTSVSIEQY
jgi:hypothetical protein